MSGVPNVLGDSEARKNSIMPGFAPKKKGECGRRRGLSALIRLGVATVRVVKDDGDGCLVKVLLQKFGDSVDVDGVECSSYIRSLRHIYPDDVPILSQVNAHPHNKVVHESVHVNVRPIQSVSAPDCRNFPRGNRRPPSDLTFILREIATGIIRNNQLDIQLLLRGRWLIQKAIKK